MIIENSYKRPTVGLYEMIKKKQPELRKLEFLDTALDLFIKKGYFKTTIQEIIDVMGASKGAFYHYFSSKEDLINGLIDEEIEKYLLLISSIEEKKDLNAIEKFRVMVTQLQAMRNENREKQIKMFHLMESKDNVLLYQQLMFRLKEIAIPHYTAILRQGKDEGHFNIQHPEYTTEAIFETIIYFRRKMALLFLNAGDKSTVIDQIREIIIFMDDIMHKILGVAPGTLNIKDEYFKYLKS